MIVSFPPHFTCAICMLFLLACQVAAVRRQQDETGEVRETGAVREPCVQSLDSSAWTYSRLGNYSPADLIAVRCDQPVLMLVQRALLRTQRLHEVDTQVFDNLFPDDFSTSERNKVLIKSAVLASANAASFGLTHVAGLVTNVLTDGVDPIYEYAAWQTQMREHYASQSEELAVKGGKAATDFWADVLLGVLQDVYRRVERIWSTATEDGFWIAYKPKSARTKLRICLDIRLVNCTCQKFAKHDSIDHDEVLKVRRFEYEGCILLKLAGGRGHVELSPFLSDLAEDDAKKAQQEVDGMLDLARLAVKDGKLVTSLDARWTAKGAQHSKFALGMGLFVAGIFTHGLAWLVASAVGIASSLTDASLAVAKEQALYTNLGYVLLALAHFERDLFEGRLGFAEPCNVDKTMYRACKEPGFACIRQGVFERRESTSTRGFCVRTAMPKLMKAHNKCLVDMDCKSGVCKMNSLGTLARKLQGHCAEGAALGSPRV